jgi:Spy/CpxP family protein refolding chaperone
MKKLMILSIALLLVSGVLLAQHPGMKGPMQDRPMMQAKMGKGMGMDCIEEMKLTDAQMKKFEELRTSFQKTENTISAEIENLKIDIHTAIRAENFSKAKELNKQIANKENLLADARIDFMAARLKELSPEQKEIMKKSMMQFMGNKPKMQGMQGGMGMQKQMGNCGDCDDHNGKEGYNNFTKPKIDTPQPNPNKTKNK